MTYFNVEILEPQIKSYCDSCSLRNPTKQPTCYKSPSNPTSIDLILTNSSHKVSEVLAC